MKTKIALARPFEGAPKINIPSVIGASMGKPIFIRIPVIGKRPIEYAIKKLEVPLLILLGHDNCGVMEYAQSSYPEIKENFQSILKCVYPAIDIDKNSLSSEDKLAKHHTLWVEEFILNNSKIVQNAVNEKKLYIAKCHLCHQTGRVKLIDSNMDEIAIPL